MLEYISNVLINALNAVVTTAKWFILLISLLIFSFTILIFRVKTEKSFDRWLQKAQTKDWFKKFMVFIHGKEYYAEYETVGLPITHNKRRAEIKYKGKPFTYTKESNEIKFLDLLIRANGEIVPHEEMAVKLDTPHSYEVEMGTTGYKTDLYETVANLRKLLREKLQIDEGEVNQLIVTVKERGYRIGNPKD